MVGWRITTAPAASRAAAQGSACSAGRVSRTRRPARGRDMNVNDTLDGEMAPVREWRGDVATLRPMLATIAEAPLVGKELVYEPKYDGIRALAELDGHEPPGNKEAASRSEERGAVERGAAERLGAP